MLNIKIVNIIGIILFFLGISMIPSSLWSLAYSTSYTINDSEFMIDEWAPYYIEGLSIGEVTIKLELLDSNGELIDSPFNPVVRKVTL